MTEGIEAIREFAPEVGIVLGSGLGTMAERVTAGGGVAYEEIAGLPASKVPGHAGRFVFGHLGNRRVLLACGRVHLYEGHPAAAVTAGIRVVAAAGVKTVVLTNAAGTLNPDFAPGSWMMLSDHLNLTGTSPLLGGPNFFDMTAVYDPVWRERFRQAAAERNMALHEGVYAGLLGPQYETPAEIRMLRTLGADAVGMSTVLEAIQARALGLRVVGFSCLTNWAAGMTAKPLSHAEVIETGADAGAAMADLLETVLGG